MGITTDAAKSAARQPSDPAEWVGKYGDMLFRFARSRVRDTAAAEELVQDAFLAAIKVRSEFRGQSTESTWLVGILKHKVIDYLRKRGREVNFSDTPDAMVDGLFKPFGHRKRRPPSWNADPAELMENEQFLQILQDCVEDLPDGQRQTFLLRTVDEQPAEEVCKELGITPTNLWVLLHRARLRLRECLQGKGFDRPKVPDRVEESAGGRP